MGVIKFSLNQGIQKEEVELKEFERRTQKLIFGPVKEGDQFRLRLNFEMSKEIEEKDIVSCTKSQRLKGVVILKDMKQRECLKSSQN